jgi:hypothetical protein
MVEMKKLIAILFIAAASFAGGVFYTARQKDGQFQKSKAGQEQKWQAERERLEKDLKLARNKPARVEQVTSTVQVPVAMRPSPQEIIDKLIALKPAGGTMHNQTIRKVVHQLESLVELGPDALPTIRAFLRLNQDVDYERAYSEEEDQTVPSASGGRSDSGESRLRYGYAGGPPLIPRTDFLYPPSLRLGLTAVLREIGGAEAEQILAEVLRTTGRGVEVATVSKFLQEMAPGKYRDVTLQAAKELLANLPQIANPSRIDEQSKGYLYGVLREYGDASFAPTAQALMIGPSGLLDRNAMNYLTTMLKEGSLPALSQACRDPRVTNALDKAAIISSVMNYVGVNPQADELFKDAVSNDTTSFLRMAAFSAIAGNASLAGPGASLTDLQLVRSRLELLRSFRPTVKDEALGRMVDRTAQSLQNVLDGKTAGTPRPGSSGGSSGAAGRGPGQ